MRSVVDITTPRRRVVDIGSLRRLPLILLPWICIVGAAGAAGAMLTGELDSTLGQTPTFVFLAAAAAAAVCVIFSAVGFPVLVIWPVAAGLAYPFVAFPKDQPLITFDRLWILGMVGCLA